MGEFADALWPYNYVDSYARETTQVDMNMRLISDKEGRIFADSTDWTVGLYTKTYDETLNRNHIKEGVDNLFDNTYKSQSKAIYGQLDTTLNAKLTLVTGLRVEQWDAEYSDSNAISIKNDELLTGGKIGLNYQYNETQLYYVTLSKGYKPGGVNAGTTLTLAEKEYQTETLWNVEAGVNSSHFDDSLKSRFNIFYGKRQDQQVKLYKEATRSFENYLSNAGEGSYYGVESQLDFYPTPELHLYSSIGLLKAQFDKYTTALEGRTPAQSPAYQYNVGMIYNLNEAWNFKTNIEGKDSYYFSNTHDQKSDAYHLVNASLAYMHGDFSLTLWGKNLTDEAYQVRGFYFPNNPATGYIDELYTQQGNPRTFGVTLSYDF